MSAATGISLWFVGEDAETEPFARVIRMCSERIGTTPFNPHITALAPIRGLTEGEVVGIAGLFASRTRPFRVAFEGASFLDHLYFQCVFAKCLKSSELMAARAELERNFQMSSGEYMPHLSLVYGDLTKPSRESLAEELDPFVKRQAGMTITRLQVWRTDGGVAGWELLRDLQLQGGDVRVAATRPTTALGPAQAVQEPERSVLLEESALQAAEAAVAAGGHGEPVSAQNSMAMVDPEVMQAAAHGDGQRDTSGVDAAPSLVTVASDAPPPRQQQQHR